MSARLRDGEMGRRGDKKPGRSESGYALLLIFAMAAALALMLYVELPRVAFEKQRDREQALIQRGEQYKRAIQLYFRKFKNYPPSIEALENTNNVRYLRRRYPDPLTGKDEWRLIHVGPGGVFTDSLTQKPKVGDKAAANLNTFITEAAAIGSALPTNQSGPAGPPRRPSEGGQLQPGSDGGTPSGVPGQMPGDPSQQGLVPGQPGVSPGQTPLPGAPPMPGSPSGTNFPPGLPGGMGQPTGDPSQPGNPGASTPGATANQPGMSPSDLIGNLLRQPRPTTPGATPGGPTGTTGIGMASITGGIAGVASKVEKHSIKIYNERAKYNEWEFIYDFSKDRTGAGRAAGAMGSGDPRLARSRAHRELAEPVWEQPGVGGQGAFGTSQASEPRREQRAVSGATAGHREAPAGQRLRWWCRLWIRWKRWLRIRVAAATGYARSAYPSRSAGTRSAAAGSEPRSTTTCTPARTDTPTTGSPTAGPDGNSAAINQAGTSFKRHP